MLNLIRAENSDGADTLLTVDLFIRIRILKMMFHEESIPRFSWTQQN
jgi:hypothetical protein